jgi:hypothetical protein
MSRAPPLLSGTGQDRAADSDPDPIVQVSPKLTDLGAPSVPQKERSGVAEESHSSLPAQVCAGALVTLIAADVARDPPDAGAQFAPMDTPPAVYPLAVGHSVEAPVSVVVMAESNRHRIGAVTVR